MVQVKSSQVSQVQSSDRGRGIEKGTWTGPPWLYGAVCRLQAPPGADWLARGSTVSGFFPYSSGSVAITDES